LKKAEDKKTDEVRPPPSNAMATPLVRRGENEEKGCSPSGENLLKERGRSSQGRGYSLLKRKRGSTRQGWKDRKKITLREEEGRQQQFFLARKLHERRQYRHVYLTERSSYYRASPDEA